MLLYECLAITLLLCNVFFVYYRNEKTMVALEKRNGVSKRWEVESRVAANAFYRLQQKRRKELCRKLHYLSVERMFLLEMKKKYAGTTAVQYML